MSSVYSKTHSPISKLIHTVSFQSRVCTVEEMSKLRDCSQMNIL
ncbi:unnamed protein product [Soboliphyme baturini]|uniref:Transcriptional regulator n=1 Tax=Soboliphyme baturini TaxID=241478 RepID=A0A183IYP8_9BILA|nr:unnamed protein product [Soboliphyme baturini]